MAGWVAVGVLLSGMFACHKSAEANEVDRERLAVMAADPIFESAVETSVREGDQIAESYSHNRYTGILELWRGMPVPEEPSVWQVREQVGGVVAELRADGWRIVGAECAVTFVDPDEHQQVEDVERVVPEHSWVVLGYRFRDGVPYSVDVRAEYRFAGGKPGSATMQVSTSTPFHADPWVDDYFDPVPAPLGEGVSASCVETGALDDAAFTDVDGVDSLDDLIEVGGPRELEELDDPDDPLFVISDGVVDWRELWSVR